MNFRLEFSTEARNILVHLQEVDPKKYNKVLKTLGLMAINLRHPSLVLWTQSRGNNNNCNYPPSLVDCPPIAIALGFVAGDRLP